jgi:creatinine amidohydrolase
MRVGNIVIRPEKCMLRELDRMTYDEVDDYLKNGPGIVVLPVGSTEEHGTHGPLGTDTFAARIVCRGVAERVDGLLAPALPYGMACDQVNYKGTVALRPSTLALLVKEICENFIRDGFRLVLLISGHRGNDHAVLSGLEEAGYSAPSTHVLYMCYQDANKGRLAEVLGPEAAAHIRADDQRYGADGHGGSIELSLAMAHAPQSVRMEKRRKPDRGPADSLRSFPFKAVLSIEEYAPTDGFFGDPSLCSEALGKRIAERTAEQIAAEVHRFLAAFPKRKKKSP